MKIAASLFLAVALMVVHGHAWATEALKSEPRSVEPAIDSGSAAAAAEQELPPTYETVVVTTEKATESLTTVTQSVRVLTPRTWERVATTTRNIATLMQYEPGQFVNPLSRNDANWGSSGGLGPSYNAYLLDGLPVDSFADAMALEALAFDRLESQRGPASVMYGNYLGMDFAGNASPLTGVTNFVLKNQIDRAASRFLVAGGSYDTLLARGFHQDRVGPLGYFFGATYERSHYTDYGTEDSWLHILQPPKYDDLKLYGSVMLNLGGPGHDVSLFAARTSRSGQVGRPNRDYLHGYDLVNLSYANQLTASVGLAAKAGLRMSNRRWGEDNYQPAPAPLDLSLREHDGVKQMVVPVDLTVSQRHLGIGLLTIGLDGQWVRYRTYSEISGVRSTGNHAEARSASFFAEEKLTFADWVLRAGGRYSHTAMDYMKIGGQPPGVDSKVWQTPLFSSGVRYNAHETWSVFANVGSSFLPPSAKAVGGTLAAADLGVLGRNGQLPNGDLKPQHGLSSDLGVDLRFTSHLRATVRTVATQVNDVIVDNVVSDEPSQTQSKNAGTARSLGAEASMNHYVNASLQWFANMTYSDTTIGNKLDADQDGTEVPFVPALAANAGITARLPFDVAVTPLVTFAGRYYDSSSKRDRKSFGNYAIVSMKMQKSLSVDTGAVVLALDLDNLTNQQVELPWQFRNPGFSALASVEIRQ